MKIQRKNGQILKSACGFLLVVKNGWLYNICDYLDNCPLHPDHDKFELIGDIWTGLYREYGNAALTTAHNHRIQDVATEFPFLDDVDWRLTHQREHGGIDGKLRP